ADHPSGGRHRRQTQTISTVWQTTSTRVGDDAIGRPAFGIRLMGLPARSFGLLTLAAVFSDNRLPPRDQAGASVVLTDRLAEGRGRHAARSTARAAYDISDIFEAVGNTSASFASRGLRPMDRSIQMARISHNPCRNRRFGCGWRNLGLDHGDVVGPVAEGRRGS